MTCFVLFSQQRSGTGALASFITINPKVKDVTEILHPFSLDHEDNFFQFWANNDPVALLRSHVSPSELFIRYLDLLEEKYRGNDILIDVKLNTIRHMLNYWEELPGFSDVGMPWVVDLFRRRRYPAVYLHRDNHLHRFVSSKLAELTGVYRTNNTRKIGQAKIEIDVTEMRDFIIKAEKSHECFMPMLEVFDQNLYLTYSKTFVGSKIDPRIKGEIADFFGFDLLAGSEPHYVKLRSAKLDKVVVNLSEVSTVLEQMDREHYLEGVKTIA